MKSTFLVFVMLLLPPLLSPSQESTKNVPLKPVYQHGRWGYADANGKVMIEPRFDAALPFSEGLARVGVVDEELPEIDGHPNLLWGYIDETGRTIVELRYNALRGFSEGLAAVGVTDQASKDGYVFRGRGLTNFRWGYVNQEGRVVIPTTFRAAGDFSEGLASVDIGGEGNTGCERSTHYGYIDKTGVIVIQPRFANAGAFKNGRARVSVGHTEFEGRCLCCGPKFVGQHGSIDRKGEFVEEKSEKGESFVTPDRREVRR
jgi:hypothetical protein